MADEPEAVQPQAVGDHHEDVITEGYTPPAQKSVDEIKQLDADDESLVKYKQALLAGSEDVLDEGGNNVVVKALVFAPEGHEKITLDLTGDLSTLKSKPIVVKEGSPYRVEIRFRVQREIVAGLRYSQNTYRKGIKVDSGNMMVGSYGPKTEEHVFKTPLDEAPSGLMHRGHYTIKSKFADDDKIIYLQWEWSLDIKKDWQ